ncbi:hypothetical protein D3C75_555750 [compost metagenome]
MLLDGEPLLVLGRLLLHQSQLGFHVGEVGEQVTLAAGHGLPLLLQAAYGVQMAGDGPLEGLRGIVGRHGVIDGGEFPLQRLAAEVGGILQRPPLVQGLGKVEMYRGEALVEGAEEGLGGFTLLPGPLNDELDDLQADLRQQGRGDAPQQLAADVRQALPHGAGKVELCDEPLQLIGDLGVGLDIERVGGRRVGELGGHLGGEQRLAWQQLDLDGLLVELQQADHLLLVIAYAIALGAREKLLEGATGIFRKALQGLELLAAQFDGGPGQTDGLLHGVAMLLQQLLDDGEIGVERGEGRIAIELLLELGEPAVQFTIVTTAGLHQLADKLDAAGAFGIGERGHAIELLLFLLKGFPESCQLSCYGSDIIHCSGRPVVIIVFVSSSNSKPMKDPVEYLFVMGCPALSSVKAKAN